MLKKVLKKLIRDPLFHHLCFIIVFLYSKTLRTEIEGEAEWKSHIENGGRVIMATWHQNILGSIWYAAMLGEYNPCFMISESDDGDLIAGVMRRLGWDTVRGSSSKGGRKALKAILKRLKRTRLVGHAVDGPTGPIGRIKPGLIRMAQNSGAAIIPIHVIPDRFRRAGGWDRHLIPLPFSRVKIKCGNLFFCDASKDREGVAKQSGIIEAQMRGYLL